MKGKRSLAGLDTGSTQLIAQAIGSALSGQWVSGSTFYRVSFHAAESDWIVA